MRFFDPSRPDAACRRHCLASSIAGLVIFALLFLLVSYLPQVTSWDATLLDVIQSASHPSADALMRRITRLGDWRLAAVLLILLLAFLSAQRCWWLSLYLLAVGTSAWFGVALSKAWLSRARPETLQSALHADPSFPSGHACTGVLLWGLLAMLLSSGQGATVRRCLSAAAALLAVLIAFSRVYLGVHWPSDVIAGMAWGYTLLMAAAWQLSLFETSLKRAHEQLPWRPAKLLAFTLPIVIGWLLLHEFLPQQA